MKRVSANSMGVRFVLGVVLAVGVGLLCLNCPRPTEFQSMVGAVDQSKEGQSHPASSTSSTVRVSSGPKAFVAQNKEKTGVKDDSDLPYRVISSNWRKMPWQMNLADASFLNREHGPAGSHGPVRRDGDSLRFADGTPAKFWGTNLTAYSLFSGSDQEIDELAQRLASAGFNLVRLHHHDSDWVKPNIFAKGPDTSQLEDSSLEKIGRLVFALKKAGIYTWLDIEVSRKFLPGDLIRGFDEIDRSDHRGFSFVNSDLKERWESFARAYLTTVLPQTGTALGQEPAVVGLLLTNENDLTQHFGNKMLSNQNVPIHNALMEEAASSFAKTHDLDLFSVLKTWEPGASKVFLSDLEHSAFTSQRHFLEALGISIPIATTSSWGKNPLFSLPSLTAGDLIDVHSYGEAEALTADPRDTSNLTSWIASAQVEGFPLTVSEWNTPAPARDRFVTPLYVASVASLQGWDALMHYAYQQYPVGARPERPDQWSSVDDPALMTQMMAAAILFRRGDVATARRTMILALSAEEFYGESVSPLTHLFLRTLVEQSRLVVRIPDSEYLDWDLDRKAASVQGTVLGPVQESVLSEGEEVVSDTRELVRNWKGGYQLINTSRSQAATGWIGNRKIELDDVKLSIGTPKAAVAVTSLDGKPIGVSQRLLLSVTAQAEVVAGKLPFVSEPVSGTIEIRSELGCLLTAKADHSHSFTKVSKTKGLVRLELSPENFSHHYLLMPAAADGSCTFASK